MNTIPTTYLPHEAYADSRVQDTVLPLSALADAVYTRAAAALRAMAQAEQADEAQALRKRADSLIDSEPSFAADLYAAADSYRPAAH